jgi:glucoamylase
MKSFGVIAVFLSIVSAQADAPGFPGIPHRWAPAAKEAVGTAYENTGAASPVWFTLAQGILTEVFYPTVDQAQIGDLQFLVTDGSRFFSEQKSDTHYQVSYVDEGMTVHVSGEQLAGKYTYEQWIVTDPSAPVVRIKTTIHFNQPGMRVFVLFKPAISNTGAQNLANATREGLFASKQILPTDDSVTAALVASTPFSAVSAGYVGFSDGLQDLSKNYVLTQTSTQVGPGNVALTGELPQSTGPDFTFEIALSFGSDSTEAQAFAQDSLSVPFNTIQGNYEAGWKGYLNTLQITNRNIRFVAESSFARRSAQIIKMHEDKRNRGAIIASLSNPAIPDSDNAFDGIGGYHLVWPRDLYHAAMGLLAAGDTKTPVDALAYLSKSQRPDGSWAQNFWIDGTPYWSGLQMDEVAFPILLAAQLKARKIAEPSASDLEMIRKAAGFIISHGPTSQQDRWEEVGGYIPATIAAEIAGLRAASFLLDDEAPAQIALDWQSKLEQWTMVTHGKWGSGYYLRASRSGSPSLPEAITITIANGGGNILASEMIDSSFLELVRLGVRDARDPRVLNTLQIYENPDNGLIESDPVVPQAKIYRRYNGDTYGYGHVGGLWPLLAGEKGNYDVAAHDLDQAGAQLFILEKSASKTGLIPEQTFGLGVAQPLVWAHAEDILLHRSIEEGKVFDAPRTSF